MDDLGELLTSLADKHGVAGIKAIADFMHAAGSDTGLIFADGTWLPCDIVMQECWELFPPTTGS